MESSKIVALKQEQILLESQIEGLTKKVKAKRFFLLSGIVSLVITFAAFIYGADGEAGDAVPFLFFVFAIAAIVFFVLSWFKDKQAKQDLVKSKKKLQEIKMELIQLEHTK